MALTAVVQPTRVVQPTKKWGLPGIKKPTITERILRKGAIELKALKGKRKELASKLAAYQAELGDMKKKLAEMQERRYRFIESKYGKDVADKVRKIPPNMITIIVEKPGRVEVYAI